MAATLYDHRVRTLECHRCGAPVEAAVSGGKLQCPYCGTVNEIAGRTADPQARPAASMADEVARLSRLKAQLESPLTGHAYDLDRTPIGCEGMLANTEKLRGAWMAAKGTAATASSPEEHRRLLWLAFRLADAYDAAGQSREERAILETALDLLSDAGHQHLVRCRLAMEALEDGDASAAAGWLAECNPAQEVLLLDSAYREAMARLRTAQGQPTGVLDVLGERGGDVPFHKRHLTAAYVLRINALEALGQPARADGELAVASKDQDRDYILKRMRKEKLALPVYLRARQKERDAIPGSFFASAAGAVWRWPIWALALFIAVTIPRCACNADPLMGVNGYALCPSVCQGCHGPLRVVTHWSCNGGECSTDGPQYFCPSEHNGLMEMSDEQLEDQAYNLGAYELSFAPAATTFLILGAFLAPFTFIGAFRRRSKHRKAREKIEEDMGQVASMVGQPVPPGRTNAGSFVQACLFTILMAAVALVVTVLEMS